VLFERRGGSIKKKDRDVEVGGNNQL